MVPRSHEARAACRGKGLGGMRQVSAGRALELAEFYAQLAEFYAQLAEFYAQLAEFCSQLAESCTQLAGLWDQLAEFCTQLAEFYAQLAEFYTECGGKELLALPPLFLHPDSRAGAEQPFLT